MGCAQGRRWSKGGGRSWECGVEVVVCRWLSCGGVSSRRIQLRLGSCECVCKTCGGGGGGRMGSVFEV